MDRISLISVVIPVYNEAPTILEVLSRVWNQPLPGQLKKELVIVESNSTDGSRAIVEKFVHEHLSSPEAKIQLILQKAPQGKGYAVRSGLQVAKGEVILIQDGDLEYDVSDYPSLLDPILSGKTEFVLGSRHLSAGNWKIRRFKQAWFLNFGGLFFHTLFNVIYGTWLTDPTTMYKVFLKKCLNGIILEADRFDFDFELLGKLIRAGYKPMEVPISYVSRGFDEGKKIRIFLDPLTWIRAIVKYRFSPLREKK